jgi:hypothetical protein
VGSKISKGNSTTRILADFLGKFRGKLSRGVKVKGVKVKTLAVPE